MSTIYTGTVKGCHIEMDEPLPLASGQRVAVTITPVQDTTTLGSPALLLEGLRRPRVLSEADVDELERLIEQGKQPARDQDPFDIGD